MKKKTFTILFYVKRTKLLRNGEAPIFMRITVDGIRAEMSINRSIILTEWIDKKGCARATTAKNKELNHYLEHIRHKLYSIQKELEDENKIVTAELLKNRYMGINEANVTFVELYTEHNKKLKELEGKDFTAATIERHETSLKHVVEFMQLKYRKNDIFLREITPDFIKEYEHFLKTVKNCAHNTTVKYIRNMGKILRLAIQKEIIKKNPISNLKFSIQEVNKEFLSEQELETLLQKEFVSDRLTNIRDVFAFCCFTGLAFIDVKGLRNEDLVTTSTGEMVIRKQRQKTGVWSNIPLLPIAKQILTKYENKPLPDNQLLPVPSNVKMNAYLKEIADVCGISKNLTTHCLRHSILSFRLKTSRLQGCFSWQVTI